MITGHVNLQREAIVPIRVLGDGGYEQEVDAIIDTGFTGQLTLPTHRIVALGLVWLTQGQTMLGNGQIDVYDVYEAVVIWDGQPRTILVEEADTTPLIGMDLMDGYDLFVAVADNGLVTLRRPAVP